MAQVPRTLPTTIPTSVTAGRLPGGPRSVATVDASPVEELVAQGNVSFDDSLLFQDSPANNRRKSEHTQNKTTLVDYAGSSRTFASIFEEGQSVETSSTSSRSGKKRVFASLVARAINIYESNNRVIHGEVPRRGVALSLSL